MAPINLKKKAIHVEKTWSKRCILRFFMSSVADPGFPTVGWNVSEGKQHFTAKTAQAFKYLYDHHSEDADWSMKADNDTYVIVENLRYFLSGQDPESPVCFGQGLKLHVKSGFPSGGAGKEALRRFGKKGVPLMNKTVSIGEDVEFGKSLEILGERLESSLDVKNKSRFHYLSPESYLQGLQLHRSHHKWNLEGGDGMSENCVLSHECA